MHDSSFVRGFSASTPRGMSRDTSSILFLLAFGALAFLTPAGLISAQTQPPAGTPLVVDNERVEVLGPQSVMVRWNTNVPAESRVVYGPVSQALFAGAGLSFGYPSSVNVTGIPVTDHAVAVGPLDTSRTTYFRPVSTASGSTATGKELSVAPVAFGSCGYVHQYLRPDDPANNPDEVRDLQAFLRGVEKDTSVSVTGVYDEATRAAVARFQLKYKDEILAPWGVSEPTGVVYITTKKKINEIFCSTRVSLTAEETAILESFKAGGGVPGGSIGSDDAGGGSSQDGGLAQGGDGDNEGTGEEMIGKGTTTSGFFGSSGGTGTGALSTAFANVKNFLAQNQLLVLFLFVAAFVAIYLLRSRGDQNDLVKEK